MTRIRELIDQVLTAYGHARSFVTDRSSLDPTLDRLPEDLPPDLLEYLDACIPIESYGTRETYSFHNLSDMILNNERAVPGCEMVEHGMLCLAGSNDGSQYAYCVYNGEIYHLDCEDYLEPEETLQDGGSYDSLEDFLLHVVDRTTRGARDA